MRKRKINDINQNHLEMTKMTNRDKGMKTCYKYIHIVKKVQESITMRTGRKHEKKKANQTLRDEKYNFSDEKYAECFNSRLDNVENISAF